MALDAGEPWLYLVIFGSFMVFILSFGLILALTQRRKKKKKALEASEDQ
ncbi:MAG: hypothetical protein KAS22_01580 [Candidatus Heimdallarchaeota archaeon]|nr:hypothetical protein [Candidatus Heimdallarchaeota archaeon]MCK5158509.1 hypothetical protein [Candidatus Heimdallarchaeota archaeon]MCK5184482.1 hypothetical protein [Candidatus Heimdallarchaeota archaeon]